MPAFSASFSGFVNGDTSRSLTTLPAFAVQWGAGSSTQPGSYPIVPSGAVDANYNIKYVNGTLTVTS